MELDLNKIAKKLEQHELLKSFIDELSKALESYNKKQIKGEKMDNIKLTNEKELEFNRKEFKFLQEYFKQELENSNKDPIYMVTDKYENDTELHRYKVAQYKNNLECKYIALEKDLPKNIKVGDMVRKKNGKYIYDFQATQYVKNCIEKIKQETFGDTSQK